MALNEFQTSIDEEERKRKLNTINDSVVDTRKIFPLETINNQPVPMGQALGTAAKDFKQLVGAGTSLIGDSFSKVGGDIAVGYNSDNQPKLNQLKNPVNNEAISTRRVGEQTAGMINQINTNSKIPGPEAFTNVAAKDRTVSNVGIQYTPQDLQLKDNISKMDAIIKAGVDPTSGKPVTLDQIEKVNQIKQQAGFLRGGTDRRPVDANGFPIVTTGNTLSKMTDSGLSVQFDSNANIPEGNKQAVMQSYGANDPKAQTLRNLQGNQFTDREFVKNYRPPVANDGILPGMNEAERIAIRSDNTSRANARLAANTSVENNVNASLSDRERNRIEGMNVTGQNKLRDIQGQVTLDPQVKQLDDLYDKKDVYNDFGQVIGQELYNKRTGELKKQSSISNPNDVINSNPAYKKAFDSASPEKRNEMLKKLNERLSAQK